MMTPLRRRAQQLSISHWTQRSADSVALETATSKRSSVQCWLLPELAAIRALVDGAPGRVGQADGRVPGPLAAKLRPGGGHQVRYWLALPGDALAESEQGRVEALGS